MKNLISTYLLGFVTLLFLTGCASTQINVPEIKEKSSRQGTALKIVYKNIPSENSIAMVTPAGGKNSVTNKPGRIDTLMIPAIEKIVKNKGYVIVDSADKANAVLTIDFDDFGVFWMSGPLSSSGEIKADISHSIGQKNSGNKVWKWDYNGSKKYGKLPGNCLVGVCSFTIIGVIPVLIYVKSQGGFEDTQMTTAGNELLKDYFVNFEKTIPEAAVLSQKVK